MLTLAISGALAFSMPSIGAELTVEERHIRPMNKRMRPSFWENIFCLIFG
jgi:hypothetical protein